MACRASVVAGAFIGLVVGGVGGAGAEPFVYQGYLEDNGAPANGVYDMLFEIYSAPVAGGLRGADSANDVVVEDGLFSVEIDVSAGGTFADDSRWLQISVSPDGVPGTTTLSPRQFVGSVPFATVDLNEPWTRTPSPDEYLAFGAATQEEVVLINRATRIGQEVFGIGGDTDGFAGMYASTTMSAGDPFYGYSAGGDVDAYHYYDGNDDTLRFFVDGGVRMNMGASFVDVLTDFAVKSGGSTKLMVDRAGDAIQIGDTSGTTDIDMVGDPDVFGTLGANDFVYNLAGGEPRSTTVFGTEFVALDTRFNDVIHFPSLNLTTGASSGELRAQVELPTGAEVQSMVVYVNDQSSTRNITVQLGRQTLSNPLAPSAELVAAFATSVSGFRSPTSGGFASATNAQTVGPDDAFYLTVFGDFNASNALAIRGVRIDYTVTKPD